MRAGLLARIGGQLQLEVFPLPDILDTAVAQRVQRVRNRLSLRVEHRRFQRDKHSRAHITSTSIRLPAVRPARTEHPIENLVDVLQLHFQIERVFHRLAIEHAHDVLVGEQQLLEVFLFVVGAHRVPLHPLVRLLARDAALGQLEQDRARKHDAPRELQVLKHAIGIHDEALHDSRESPQHVIERDEAVRQDHALDRRMRDVALVPERDVLERGVRVGAQQARKPRNLLATNRIALVRHRRRALLALAERLLHFADLGFLQSANLEREFLERRAGDGDGRQQLGVTIPLNHLRGHRRRLQSKPPADGGLDRRDRGGRTCRPRQKSFQPRRSLARAEPVVVALQLRVPERKLQAERHRLGVDAVGAARSSACGDAPRRATRTASSSASMSFRSRSVASRI